MSEQAPPPRLPYARADLYALTITREQGVVRILIPPLGAKRFAWRMTLWSAATLWCIVGVAARFVPPSWIPRYLSFLCLHTVFFPLPLLAGLGAVCAFMLVRVAWMRGTWVRIGVDEHGIHLDYLTALIPRRLIPLTRVHRVTQVQICWTRRISDQPRPRNRRRCQTPAAPFTWKIQSCVAR